MAHFLQNNIVILQQTNGKYDPSTGIWTYNLSIKSLLLLSRPLYQGSQQTSLTSYVV